MRIQNRTARIVFNLVISVIAALATWIQFLSFGLDAWRLLPTWVALLAVVYYGTDALADIFAKNRAAGSELCPMIQGGLIVSGIVLIIIQIVGYAMDSYIPGARGNTMLISFILPVLMILSWSMFSVKGKWRVSEPFYWLAIIMTYIGGVLASAEFMSRSARMIYPYEFLNYPLIGIDTMLLWLLLLASIVLIIGYVFWLLDFSLSGELSQHIVMPKIKTVVIEEEIEDEPSDTESYEKPTEKPVKLVTTGSRSLPVLATEAKLPVKTKPKSQPSGNKSKPQTSVEPKTKPQPEPKSKGEPSPKNEDGSKARIGDETKVKDKPQPKNAPRAKIQSEPKPEPKTKTDGNANASTNSTKTNKKQPDGDGREKPNKKDNAAKTEKSKDKPGPRPELRVESKSEVEPEPKPSLDPSSKS